MDIYGDHATCCKKGGDLITRHNSIRDLCDRIATEALLSPVMEKKGILGPTSGRRPADVLIPNWVGQDGLAIDFAVTCPVSKTNVKIESPCEDYAEVHKHRKYDVSFRGHPFLFTAVVFETLGAINVEGELALKQIFRFAAKRTGREFSSYCGRAWARFSCVLQRAVSQAILTRTSGQPGPQSEEFTTTTPDPAPESEGENNRKYPRDENPVPSR